MMTANFRSLFRTVWLQVKSKFLAENGQDLVEYALVVAVLSFCAIAAERNVATSISAAYDNLSTQFNADL